MGEFINEYIDREKALDALLFGLVGTGCQSRAISAIRDVPTADVVEVVRCKDCVWWEARTYGSTIGRCENPRNGLVSEYSDHTDFCSYGERKE